jgi:glucose-1-phosphate cytidylyltransferase
MNGGFFVLSNQIFDYMGPGEELVVEPFQRLVETRQLCTIRHNGFWGCMDTYKEKQHLDEMVERGETPWQVWRGSTSGQPRERSFEPVVSNGSAAVRIGRNPK